MAKLRYMADQERSQALEAYLRTDYDACLDLLRGERGAERDLLLARTYIRMGRAKDAEELLKASSASQRSTWFVLMGLARAAQDDPAGGEVFVDEGLARARDRFERAEALHKKALLCWMQGKNDEAAAILKESDFNWQSHLAEELRGQLAAERYDYADAAAHYERAATLAASASDLNIVGSALRNASLYARERYMPAVMENIARTMCHIAWTPYLEISRYYIERAAAWFTAINGDYIDAMRQLRAVGGLNVSEPWRAYALCDRAYLSLVLGEEINGWAMAEDALEASERIDFGKFNAGEHTLYLYLANLFAARRPADAQRCFERYSAIKPDASMNAWSRAPHQHAWEAFTAGLLEPDARRAVEHLHQAFSIYRRIGYDWRAALTLLALRDRGVVRSGYDDYVASVLQRYPNSWLRDLAEREFKKTPLPLVAAA
jgi:hypothetical protein